MQEVKIKVYTFDELSNVAKENAVQDYQEHHQVDYDYWDDLELDSFLPEEIQEMMSEKYNLARKINNEVPVTKLFTYKEFYFDFERRRYIQFKDLDYTSPEVFMKFLKIPKRLWDKMNKDSYYPASFEENNERTNRIVFVEEGYDGDEADVGYTAKEKEILKRAENIFDDLMNKVLKSLEEQYQYLYSEECAIEDMQANDYKFTVDGKRYD